MISTVPSYEEVAKWVKSGLGWQHCLTLPSTFDEYTTMVDKDVRTQCRKAQRLGYTVRKTLTPSREDIGDIWDSWNGVEKQERDMDKRVQHFCKAIGMQDIEDVWPFVYYPHTQGYLDFWEVWHPQGFVVAYMELASASGDCTVFGLLGHKDYLKHGIMKFLFVEVIKQLIERGDKRLHYLKLKYTELRPEKRYFVQDLGFKR